MGETWGGRQPRNRTRAGILELLLSLMQRETGDPSDREQCHSLRDGASSPM